MYTILRVNILVYILNFVNLWLIKNCFGSLHFPIKSDKMLVEKAP